MKWQVVTIAAITAAYVVFLALHGGIVAEEPAAGDAKAPAEPSAEQVIAKSAADFMAAFNRHDAKAVAEFWSSDGEYIDENGQRFVGREAIAKEYADFFAAVPGAKLHVTVDEVRLLSPTTAIEDGHASVTPMPRGAPARARYTAVHVKQDGKWKMASVRDTRVETKSTYGRLRELEWMVGDWTASHGGVTAELRCRWVAQKSNLELEYTVREDGHELSSSTEMIGWDPVDGRIMSWTFASGGGRAIGVWTPRDGAWVVESVGVSANGAPSTTVLIWARLAGDALGWTSTQSTFGGAALDDTGEVIFKRK